MLTGTIVKGIGGFYYVQTDEGRIECRAKGRFRNEHILPMVGDKVDIEVENGKGSVANIHPRSSELIRPPVANIDQLVVVASIASPDPNYDLIDSFLIRAQAKGLAVVLCINKTDLADCETVQQIYEEAGYRVICESARKNEVTEELRAILKDKISAFAGNSGVGKSSLLNVIMPELGLQTGDVSKILQGKHTTRHVELFKLADGGFVLDTPGFSTFDLPEMKADQLQYFFPEFEEYLGGCRFRGCAHVSEPDCAVRKALVDGHIHLRRYESYVKIHEQLKLVKEWEK